MSSFRPDAHGMAEIQRLAEDFMSERAEALAKRARQKASAVSSSASVAITTGEVGHDSEGTYQDVGYDKHHRGFFLWWHEVGTVNHPATPHLRPALYELSDGDI